MEFWFDEDDAVEEFLDYGVLVIVERVGDGLKFGRGIFVDGSLNGLSCSCVLMREVRDGSLRVDGEGTFDSKDLKSRSLDCLYASISLLASLRASLSF